MEDQLNPKYVIDFELQTRILNSIKENFCNLIVDNLKLLRNSVRRAYNSSDHHASEEYIEGILTGIDDSINAVKGLLSASDKSIKSII